MSKSPQMRATRSATNGGISASSARSRHGVPAGVGLAPMGWVVVLTQRRLSWCRSCSSRQLRLLCSDHVLPEDIFTRLSGGHHYCELATVHHRDAVGEREHFVELGADEQNGQALRERIEQLLVDELYRANVDAAGRLRCEQHGAVAAHFPGDHHFLLIAAGKGA